ncbi:endonuclease/exonuclease/phosphatase family protein [Kitasatospora griseola]
MSSAPVAVTDEPHAPDDDLIEHINANIQHGQHVDQFLEWIDRRAFRPHLMTLQELQDGQAARIADHLGLAFEEEPNIRPGSRNALFYDRAVFRPFPGWKAYLSEIRHRPATARLHLIDPATGALSRRKLGVASIHADFGSPEGRLNQLRWLLSNLIHDGRLGLVAGDWNSWPAGRAPLSLDRVEDRAWALNRSILDRDGVFRPDDQADRLMTYRGMADVGRYAATVLGQVGADRPTSGHGSDKFRQLVPDEDLPPGGLGPIDRTYVSDELTAALISSETPASPEVQAISDHLPQITRWTRSGLWGVMNRDVVTFRH